MHVNILGIRGLPASHGGFETFAAKLAPYLVAKGHSVTVYCQEDDGPDEIWEDTWNGINRVHIKPKRLGPLGTVEFDFISSLQSVKRDGIDLILGYNTGFLAVLQRIAGKKSAMNMDGIEWKRGKWGLLAKAWFYVNEIAGANFTNIAIADHPEIAIHVKKRCFKEPIMIPYGADKVEAADESVLSEYGLSQNNYFISIARVEPENSILEIVQAFSQAKTNAKLMVLGKFENSNQYHQAVLAAGNSNVIFPGAIYDQTKLAALRYYSLAYLHGHTVGGTNPSLVEALGASNTVIAHDNRFNRWVCGAEQFFFSSVSELAGIMANLSENPELISRTRVASQKRFDENFQWEMILSKYEDLLMSLES